MSRAFWMACLVAACGLTAAAQVIDAPGVNVMLNGAPLLHRAAVAYPKDAANAGVQGMVSVQVKLDSKGEVSDASVLSGPDELRSPVLRSVLQWHFGSEVAGTTRTIQVSFELPKTSDTAGALIAGQRANVASPAAEGQIKSIRISGLSQEATAQLQTSLPVKEGDQWNADSMQRTMQAVKAFDEHLTVRTGSMLQSASAQEVSLTIDSMTSGSPGTIKVGGNVQGSMIVTKVAPIYPAAAKASGIQGVVHLAAQIGKDGTVEQVNVLSGPDELTEAAVDAVKQWVYRPTLLNGSPVEVQTTIDINFTLAQ